VRERLQELLPASEVLKDDGLFEVRSPLCLNRRFLPSRTSTTALRNTRSTLPTAIVLSASSATASPFDGRQSGTERTMRPSLARLSSRRLTGGVIYCKPLMICIPS
jgi:hypothetical protein